MEKGDGAVPLSSECRSWGLPQELWELFGCHYSLPSLSCSPEQGASTSRDAEQLLFDQETPWPHVALPHPCGYPKHPATTTHTDLVDLAGHPKDEHTLQTVLDEGTQHPLQLVDAVPEKSTAKGAARHPDLLPGASWSVTWLLVCERSSIHAKQQLEVLPEHWEEQSRTLSGAT